MQPHSHVSTFPAAILLSARIWILKILFAFDKFVEKGIYLQSAFLNDLK